MSMITIKTQVDVEELFEGLGTALLDSSGRAAIIDFVIRLDENAADWDVTLALCDHFDKKRAEHAKEEEEDARAEAGKRAFLAHNHELAFGGKP